jgi:hypothetical protein
MTPPVENTPDPPQIKKTWAEVLKSHIKETENLSEDFSIRIYGFFKSLKSFFIKLKIITELNLFDQISHCGHFILLVPKQKSTSSSLINQNVKDDNNKLQKFVYSFEAEAAAAQKQQSSSSSASTDTSQSKPKLFRYLSNVIPHLISKDNFKKIIDCDNLYHQTFINSDLKTGKYVCFLEKNEKKIKFENGRIILSRFYYKAEREKKKKEKEKQKKKEEEQEEKKKKVEVEVENKQQKQENEISEEKNVNKKKIKNKNKNKINKNKNILNKSETTVDSTRDVNMDTDDDASWSSSNNSDSDSEKIKQIQAKKSHQSQVLKPQKQKQKQSQDNFVFSNSNLNEALKSFMTPKKNIDAYSTNGSPGSVIEDSKVKHNEENIFSSPDAQDENHSTDLPKKRQRSSFTDMKYNDLINYIVYYNCVTVTKELFKEIQIPISFTSPMIISIYEGDNQNMDRFEKAVNITATEIKFSTPKKSKHKIIYEESTVGFCDLVSINEFKKEDNDSIAALYKELIFKYKKIEAKGWIQFNKIKSNFNVLVIFKSRIRRFADTLYIMET